MLNVAMSSTKMYNRITIGTAVIGAVISFYALYVEMKAEGQPDYVALCDFAEYARCSRVLTSDYSKGFGLLPKGSSFSIPNCIYGVIFYCFMIKMSAYDSVAMVTIQCVAALQSVVISIYLAYILIFVLRDICVVCILTYFVNLVLSFVAYKKLLFVKRGANNVKIE